MLELMGMGSFDFHCIVITDSIEQDQDIATFNAMEGRLFSEKAPKAIYNKDISYDLNEQAVNFADMFGITMNKYTIDNYKANSCYVNMLITGMNHLKRKIP